MKKFFKGLGSGLLYFAIYFGVQLAVSFAATFLFMFIAMADVNVGAFYNDPTVMENVLTKVMEMTYEHAMLLTLISNVVLIPILWLIFVFRKKKFFSEIEYKSINPLFIPVIAVAGCALNVVVALVMGYLPIPEEIMESYNEMASMIGDGNPIVSFISAGLIAPVVEEIVFRGLIFTRFKKGMPVWVAAVLSSLIFGAMHGHIVWSTYAFVLGLILCWFFSATNSLWGSTILHLAFNTFNYALNAIIGEEPTTFGVDMVMLGVGLILTVVTVFFTVKLKNKNRVEVNEIAS